MHPISSRRPSAPGRPARRRSGFFLLELLAVLALSAIVVTAVLPGLQGLLRAQRVRQAAQDLAQDLAWASSEASRRNAPTMLRLRASPGCQPQRCGWDIQLDENGDGEAQPDEAVIGHYDLPDRVRFGRSTSDTVHFDRRGNNAQRAGKSKLGESILIEASDAPAAAPVAGVVCLNAGNRARIVEQSACAED